MSSLLIFGFVGRQLLEEFAEETLQSCLQAWGILPQLHLESIQSFVLSLFGG